MKAARWAVLILFFCVSSVLLGCGAADSIASKAAPQKTITVKDSVGREVELPYPLERVAVCNVYNAELITAVGAIDRIVGVDNYIFQDQSGFKNRFKQEQVFGISQNAMNYEKLAELAPQAVIITGNGTWQDAQDMLDRFGIKVIVINSYYTEQFADNCRLIGKIFGREQEAAELADYFGDKLAYIQKQLQGADRRKLYFEYRTLGKTAAPGDYFYKMVEYSGADNIFADARGGQVDQEAIIAKDPQYIVKVADAKAYSSYVPPSLAEEKQIKQELIGRSGWAGIDAVRHDRILLLSHYLHGGASKLVGTMYIAKFLYPEYLPDLHPEDIFRTWLEKYQGLDYVAGHSYPRFAFDD
ncbi:ABC transporter substrate-binding protein [uncultured Phascolarctobacterium sp.]|uniref:ABC transporter substrate-binding protein n=1 Tax=Phascolarctobacterium sp. TaxID=2049039 RepID=UPI0025E82A0A|nr:ABC transporter substrate-binding protein [uncultured Phascolarctobacterium sp.]